MKILFTIIVAGALTVTILLNTIGRRVKKTAKINTKVSVPYIIKIK